MHQETKESRKNRESEVFDTTSSYPRSKKVEPVREKRSTRFESERPKTELKITEKFVAEDLDERMIVELAKRVREIQGYYPTNRATDAIEGITKTTFTPEIEK